MIEKLVELIELDDLNENNRYIADMIGIDSYRELVKKFYGDNLYIQDPRSNKKIVAEYVRVEISRNKPLQRIAKELGRSVRCLREMIQETQIN
jgi:hypothetical protein